MCIVVIKPKGYDLPSKAMLKTCFRANPDGAGIMYAQDGIVNIQKGFMGFRGFWKYHQDMMFGKRDSIVYHFRIATAGGVSPETSHPFPISNDLNMLSAVSSTDTLAVAHNGVIPIKTDKGLSDTMSFIKDIIFPVKSDLLKRKKPIFQLIEMGTRGSKLAFMYGNGDVITTGTGWIKEGGLWFSNDSDLDTSWKYNNWNWSKSLWGAKGNDERLIESDMYCENCGARLLQYGNEYYCEDCDYTASKDYVGKHAISALWN